jgi:hypothetical protein
VVIRTAIKATPFHALESPEIKLTSEGSILGVIEELWENALFELFEIVHAKAPAMRLP